MPMQTPIFPVALALQSPGLLTRRRPACIFCGAHKLRSTSLEGLGHAKHFPEIAGLAQYQVAACSWAYSRVARDFGML